jgi:hypothetical protein
MSLHGRPVEQTASLPDGREVLVRVGIPEDSYISSRYLATVDVELSIDGHPIAAINTVLGPDQNSAARELAREIVAGLESGGLEPTAAALEPLADEPR